MKICSKCKVNKELNCFSNRYDRPSGKRSKCKQCEKEQCYLYRSKDINKYNDYQKSWNDKNRQKININAKEYRLKNKDKIQIYCKENSKKRIKNNKNWSLKFKQINGFSYQTYLRNKHILIKVKTSLRNRLRESLKYKSWSKNTKFSQYIGCNKEQLLNHLESQFKDNMCWDNYGYTGWHIDHIIPLSSAKTEEEMYKLCHYTNLQPLWAKDNLKKSNKIIGGDLYNV